MERIEDLFDFPKNQADIDEEKAESERLKALIEAVQFGGQLVHVGYVERTYANQAL